jgi:hypothetical protein
MLGAIEWSASLILPEYSAEAATRKLGLGPLLRIPSAKNLSVI